MTTNLNLRLARRENQDVKTFEKCFEGGKVSLDLDMARQFDAERAWDCNGFTNIRTTEDSEIKSIGRTRINKIPTYTVYGWKSSGYSHWEPPDVWEVELSKEKSLVDALLMVDFHERRQQFDCFAEGEFWEKQAEMGW